MISAVLALPRYRIIDRYVLRQFVWNFLACLMIMSALYTIFDVFTNLDQFMEYADKHGRLAALLARFFLFRTLAFFDTASGILAVIAGMFTLTWLQRTNEITALTAAGISKLRIAAPVIFAAGVIALISAANRELVLPNYIDDLGRDTKDLTGDSAQVLRPRYDQKSSILFRGQHTVAKDQKIESPNFLLPDGLNRYGRQLVAESAYYQPATDARPSGWLLRKVSEPADFVHKPSLIDGEGERVILTPMDADWLEPGDCFLISDMTFEQLAGGKAWLRFSSTATLIEALRNESLDFGADVRVSIHARVVRPFLDVILLMLGLPLVLSRENRNVFISAGLCLVLVAVFVIVVLGSQALGKAVFLAPDLACWLPVIIFVPITALMSKQLST